MLLKKNPLFKSSTKHLKNSPDMQCPNRKKKKKKKKFRKIEKTLPDSTHNPFLISLIALDVFDDVFRGGSSL